MRRQVVVAILVSGFLSAKPAGSRPATPRRPPSPAPVSEGRPGHGTDVPFAELTRFEPSGITSEQVGSRAASTGFEAQSREETLRGAQANVELARMQFLPRVTVTARYTRLSDFTPPVIFAGPPGVNQVFTTQSVGTPGSGIDPAQAFAQPAPAVTFPTVLDNYLLQASLLVPVSDYFLRVGQAYSAATHAARAAGFDLRAARTKSAVDGQIVYYGWLLARGAAIVASLAVTDQGLHLKDARNQFAAGSVSHVDVLRAETAVMTAELQLERARNQSALEEKRVRIAVHAKDDERIVPGEGLETADAEEWGPLVALTREALMARLEIKSIDASAEAAAEQADAGRAAALPQLNGFADAIDANPNPRRIPQAPGWVPTWQVGIQLVWSPNDALGTSQMTTDARVRAAQLRALRVSVRDGVELEVLQAFQAVHASRIARDVTKRDLETATEAKRVARQLFNSGRATSTLVVDAQTVLTRARLDALGAAAEARIARVRLQHALGRDARNRP
jgi:outer membrane protein TolC